MSESTETPSIAQGPQHSQKVLDDEFEYPLRSAVSLGRKPGVRRLVLNHPHVSGRHARVQAKKQHGHRLINDSPFGSYVGGQAVQRRDLEPGDVLTIGPFQMKYTGHSLKALKNPLKSRLSAQKIGVKRGAQWILQEFSVDTQAGQLIALVGPSGSGKSTALKALAGEISIQSGRIRYQGMQVKARDLKGLIGYVPQDDVLPSGLTSFECLDYQARLQLPSDIEVDERRAAIRQLFHDLELNSCAGKRVQNLSGGQRKRLSLAMEMLSQPAILLLDEPLSNIQAELQSKFMALFRKLCDQGHTILMVTHQSELLDQFDRVLKLEKGRLVNAPNDASETLEASPIPFVVARKPGWRQIWPLFQRQTLQLWRNPRQCLLLLAQTLLVALSLSLAVNTVSAALFMLILSVLWLSLSSSALGLVNERQIHERERRHGLSPLAYFVSKVLFFGVLIGLQCGLLLAIVRRFQELPGAWPPLYGVLLLTAFVGLSCGLTLSSFAKSSEQANVLVPLVLIPQLLFGGLFPFAKAETQSLERATFSRWCYDLALKVTLQNQARSWLTPLNSYTRLKQQWRTEREGLERNIDEMDQLLVRAFPNKIGARSAVKKLYGLERREKALNGHLIGLENQVEQLEHDYQVLRAQIDEDHKRAVAVTREYEPEKGKDGKPPSNEQIAKNFENFFKDLKNKMDTGEAMAKSMKSLKARADKLDVKVQKARSHYQSLRNFGQGHKKGSLDVLRAKMLRDSERKRKALRDFDRILVESQSQRRRIQRLSRSLEKDLKRSRVVRLLPHSHWVNVQVLVSFALCFLTLGFMQSRASWADGERI